MPGLLRDRYFEFAPNRAWDLVTGESVSPERCDDTAPRSRAPGALIELLEHGVDGVPRWIASGRTAGPWRPLAAMIAAEASRRGYVPVAVDIFLRTRSLLASDLRTRAIVLIARPDTTAQHLHTALLHAAALSARPHVLLSFFVPPHRSADNRWRVAEARAIYGARAGRPGVPAPCSAEAARLLEKAGHSSELVKVGRHAAAERLLRQIAAALVRRRSNAAAAQAYIELGRVLLERGSVAAADTAFDQAATLAEDQDGRLIVAARIWQAAARTDAGQLTSAESLCRAALAIVGSDGELRLRAEAALGRVLVWQGRVREAAALPFVQESPLPDAYVAATVVRILIEAGDVFNAGLRARDLTDRTADADATTRLIAAAAHLRVLFAAGDLTLAAERLRAFAGDARIVRTPLRLARMRLLWSAALQRAGRSTEADRELRVLARMRLALPPLLRSAIERGSRPTPRALEPSLLTTALSTNAVDLVTLAQRDDDDAKALKRIGEFLLRELRATRVDLWTADGGPPTAVITCGAGLPTRLGPRALEAGTTIGPEVVESGWELSAPVRLGQHLIASLAVRWSADRASVGDPAPLLNLAAAIAAPRLESMIQAKRQVVQAATAIPELVGISAAIADVRRAVIRAAPAPFSVMVEGESGVGKELVARAIHHLGPRRDRRFCDVNCAALPDDLFESELFGHARGAFTGAVSDRPGLVEEADGGTLFLDEVADLSARAQAKLLRVVQQQELRRIGETFARKVDVRFVSAANRDLRLESEQGRFRQDLLYRLDVIRIRIPPLRERPEDVPVLARHFWTAAALRVNSHATLSHGVIAALARYHWPGNVRELQNVMAALAVDSPGRGPVRATLLPAAITRSSTIKSARLSEARIEWERRFVEVALARAGDSRTRAARDLGLTRQGLLKVLARLRLLNPPTS